MQWNVKTADVKNHLHFSLHLSLCWGPFASCCIFLGHNFKAVNESSHTASSIYDSVLMHRPLVVWEKLVTGPNIKHTKTGNKHCCHQVELEERWIRPFLGNCKWSAEKSLTETLVIKIQPLLLSLKLNTPKLSPPFFSLVKRGSSSEDMEEIIAAGFIWKT